MKYILLIFVSISLLIPLKTFAQQNNLGNNSQLSSTCKFDQGLRAGQIQSFKGMVQPIPVGSPCTDGHQNYGVAIPDDSISQSSSSLSSTCKYNQGHRAGQIQSFKGMVHPIPIGSPCTDGQQSYGVAIPDE